MSGTKTQQLKVAMDTILSDLRHGDSFNIISFNDKVKLWSEEDMVWVDDENIARAKEFTQGMQAYGGTDKILILLFYSIAISQRRCSS